MATFGPQEWAKGTRGLLGAHATDKPRIINARQAKDGSLVPRPVWVENASYSMADIPGGIWGWDNEILVAEYQYSPTDLWVQLHNPDTGAVTRRAAMAIPTVPVTTIRGLPQVIDDNTILWGGSVFQKDNGGPSAPWPDGPSLPPMGVVDVRAALVAAVLTGSDDFEFRSSALHQGRVFINCTYRPSSAVGFVNELKGRIYFSDAYSGDINDYATFTSATQFFDVDGSVAGMISLGSNLVIWTEEGEWYVLQGRGNPDDATLNSLGPQRIPSFRRYIRRIDQSGIFMSSDGTVLCSLAPEGKVDDRALANLGYSESVLASGSVGDTPLSAVTDSLSNTIIVPTDAGAYVNYNGVWSEETWPAEFNTEDGTFSFWSDYRQGVEYAVEDDTGTTWTIYKRNILDENPPNDEVFDNPTSTLVLPRIVEPGNQVRVHKVVIDVRTFSDTDPLPDMDATIIDGDNQTVNFVAGPDDPPFARAGSTEESHQILLTCDLEAFTHFCDITITFSGLNIERAYVEYETLKEPVL